jgi:DNA-binding transcriptional ArsR family regulator
MTEREAPSPITGIDDPRYVKALAHPVRVRILAMLGERDASPVQIGHHLEASLGTISYHVRTLERLGLVEMVATHQRRGAIEHVYRACPHPAISDFAWSNASQISKQALISSALAQAGEYATRSATAGGFDRLDAFAGRVALRLDEQGWTELAEAVKQLRIKALDIERLSQERLSDTDESSLDVGLVLLLFEALPFFDTSPSDHDTGSRAKRPRARSHVSS